MAAYFRVPDHDCPGPSDPWATCSYCSEPQRVCADCGEPFESLDDAADCPECVAATREAADPFDRDVIEIRRIDTVEEGGIQDINADGFQPTVNITLDEFRSHYYRRVQR